MRTGTRRGISVCAVLAASVMVAGTTTAASADRPAEVVTQAPSADFDRVELTEVALELSENDPATLQSLGLGTIDSVSIDTETGAATIYVTGAPTVTEVEYKGHLASVATGVTTELQIGTE